MVNRSPSYSARAALSRDQALVSVPLSTLTNCVPIILPMVLMNHLSMVMVEKSPDMLLKNDPNFGPKIRENGTISSMSSPVVMPRISFLSQRCIFRSSFRSSLTVPVLLRKSPRLLNPPRCSDILSASARCSSTASALVDPRLVAPASFPLFFQCL